MEAKSIKLEILKDLIELKEKGVYVKIHDSLISRNSNLIFGSVSCGHTGNYTVKSPKELEIDIYLNSSEDEIKNLIQTTKYSIELYEKNAEISAIVEFLREELK